MKLRCAATTLSGARTFASSGQRRRGTALESSAPMPPSPTITGPFARRSSEAAHAPQASGPKVNRRSQPSSGDGSTGNTSPILRSHRERAPMRRGPSRRELSRGPMRRGSGQAASLGRPPDGAGRRPRPGVLDRKLKARQSRADQLPGLLDPGLTATIPADGVRRSGGPWPAVSLFRCPFRRCPPASGPRSRCATRRPQSRP